VLTVQSLLDELDLELAAGGKAVASPVRWVHISELEDPTPWLSGGELMLTTGIPLDTAAKQREFVRLLADSNLAGLGLGTGFSHQELPVALVDEADKRDFPLFEVPYSTPFIAITEKAFARLVNEQYEVLQRGIAVQRRLERLVLEERGLEEIAATIASAVGVSAANSPPTRSPASARRRSATPATATPSCPRIPPLRVGRSPIRSSRPAAGRRRPGW
jgi:purine catabolism regulator